MALSVSLAWSTSGKTAMAYNRRARSQPHFRQLAEQKDRLTIQPLSLDIPIPLNPAKRSICIPLDNERAPIIRLPSKESFKLSTVLILIAARREVKDP